MFKKPDNAYSSIDQPKKHQEKNYGNNLENNKTCDMKALQGTILKAKTNINKPFAIKPIMK